MSAVPDLGVDRVEGEGEDLVAVHRRALGQQLGSAGVGSHRGVGRGPTVGRARRVEIARLEEADKLGRGVETTSFAEVERGGLDGRDR